MQIILTGYRGVGKSTIGAILAGRLKTKLIDTDDEICKVSGITVAGVVEKEGWGGFRRREAVQVRKALMHDCVIAVGGGALIENNIKLPARAVVVLLTATHTAIARRIRGSERPALTKKTAVNEIRGVMKKRMQKYLQAAHIVVDTTGKKPQTVASEILKVLE